MSDYLQALINIRMCNIEKCANKLCINLGYDVYKLIAEFVIHSEYNEKSYRIIKYKKNMEKFTISAEFVHTDWLKFSHVFSSKPKIILIQSCKRDIYIQEPIFMFSCIIKNNTKWVSRQHMVSKTIFKKKIELDGMVRFSFETTSDILIIIEIW